MLLLFFTAVAAEAPDAATVGRALLVLLDGTLLLMVAGLFVLLGGSVAMLATSGACDV